ncbi:hypothetical protein C7T94_12375 [Pedobacter yulinensis]|uniref:Uncharacterized protein n=1 Tax=Pedobacter yulinensis TaxID=2126353 RepID=A0A2T3HLR3_9SPHI|nr:hypothetical protein [Pedobacter yulinensis]PST83366.1 hypothetical protein C7T94_12375 [Pedobacter yulinensis]
MAKNDKLSDDLNRLRHLDDDGEAVHRKLDEFINLLEASDLDSENIKKLKSKLDQALETKLNNKSLVKEIQRMSMGGANLETLDQLEFLLTSNHLDSREAKKIRLNARVVNVFRLFVGILLITLGFAMIVMPAPPYFEMFTIFYFTADDGFTLMDLISLIIVATGIFIMIRSLINTKIDG